jgi:hypothetical protein
MALATEDRAGSVEIGPKLREGGTRKGMTWEPTCLWRLTTRDHQPKRSRKWLREWLIGWAHRSARERTGKMGRAWWVLGWWWAGLAGFCPRVGFSIFLFFFLFLFFLFHFLFYFQFEILKSNSNSYFEFHIPNLNYIIQIRLFSIFYSPSII